MSDEWRRYLYEGAMDEGTVHVFAVPAPTAPGVPGRYYALSVTLQPLSGSCACGGDERLVCGHIAQAWEACRYWILRESWRAEPTEALEQLYAKWLPRRDAVLGKETHLGKSRAEWERFYLALADEVAARQHAAGRVSAAFGLDGKAFLKALMGQQGAGVAG